MIFDNLKNIDFYKSLGVGDRYAKAIDWLKTQDLDNLEVGKYEIDGSDVYALVQSYETIPKANAVFEAHEKYSDIQFIISGCELMSYAPIEVLVPTGPYNPEKDIIKYDDSVEGVEIPVTAGEFAIFFPWDGHQPKAAVEEPEAVRKIVIKIREN